MLSNYICALDIGSSKIAAAVARLKNRLITDVYFESIPSKGIKKGLIVDSVGLTECVGVVMKALKEKSKINIRSTHVNLSGKHIINKHSRAIIPLAERGNKVITVSDIQKVTEQAIILGSHIDEEIIHYFPWSYTIDSSADIVNPLGLYSHKLETDLFLLCGKISSIQTITHVVNQAGYDIKSIFFSGLATAAVVFDETETSGNNVLCDIGSDVTEILFFKDGLLKNINILSLGGDDLTRSLEESLNIPWDLAEDIKVSYGSIGDPSRIPEDKEVLIKKDNSYDPVSQRLVCEIITKKAKTICMVIKEAVEKEVRPKDINRFITTGRTIFQDGLLETLESTIGSRIALGRSNNSQVAPFLNLNDVLLGQKYLTYITSLGLIFNHMTQSQPGQYQKFHKVSNNPLAKLIHKTTEVWQEYF
jgi:cell division protein FtsA